MSVLSIQDSPTIRVRLREAMQACTERTGHRMTYESLAAATGLSVAALQSLGSRAGYNATLATIAKVCAACGCSPGDLLELGDGGAEEAP